MEQAQNLEGLTIRVIGVGNAGCTAVAHMFNAGFTGVQYAVVNTDASALDHSPVQERLLLAGRVRRGLGTGGDPEQGRAAAEAEQERLSALCEDADMVVIVAGLGGGTGTGVSPIIARLARDCGALVLALVALPFDFEGTRRGQQANLGIQLLKATADSVICVPNQKVFKLVDEATTAEETFGVINQVMVEGLRSVWRMLTQPGLIQIDFADFCAITRGRHSESYLATATVAGPDRAKELVRNLMAHPLLDEGQALTDADALLVSLVGGSGLTMSEVARVMEQIQRQSENANLIVGAAVDPNLGDQLSVTLVASHRPEGELQVRPGTTSPASLPPRGEPLEEEPTGEFETRFFQTPTPDYPPSRFVPPPPDFSPQEKERILSRRNALGNSGRRRNRLEQGVLPLDVVSRGRFEKSDPTVHHGKDLDIPTFVRRGVSLN